MNSKEFLKKKETYDTKPNISDTTIETNMLWSSNKINTEKNKILENSYGKLEKKIRDLKKYTSSFVAILDTGENFNQKIKQIPNVENITEIRFVKAAFPEDGVDVSLAKDKRIIAHIQDNILYITSDSKIYANENCQNMFSNTEEKKYFDNLNSITFDNFISTNIKNITSMFKGCGIKSIDLTKINTSKVSNFTELFAQCKNLTSLNISKISTTNVTNVEGMFEGCSSLKNVDLSNFNTTKVTSFSKMFKDMTSLTSIDVSKFNITNVTDVSSMFEGCNNLQVISGIGKWDTYNIKYMSKMFLGCEKLNSLILSAWRQKHDTIMNNTFEGCISLSGELKITNDNFSRYTDIFKNCSIKENTKFIVKYDDYRTKERAEKIVNTKTEGSNVELWDGTVTLLDGLSFNRKIKKLNDFYIGSTIHTITFLKETPPNPSTLDYVDVSEEQNDSIIAYCESDVLYVKSKDNILANKNCDYMFLQIFGVKKVIFDNFDVKNTTSMKAMFRGYDFSVGNLNSKAPEIPIIYLEEIIGLEKWNTSKVTNMSYMFYKCNNLKNIKGTNKWNLENVTNMSYMFCDCWNLRGEIKLSEKQSILEVEPSSYENMFYSCCVGNKDCAFIVDYTIGTELLAREMVKTKGSVSCRVDRARPTTMVSGNSIYSAIPSGIKKIDIGLGVHRSGLNGSFTNLAEANDNSIVGYKLVDEPETYYIRSNNKIRANTDCSNMFASKGIIEVIFENIDMSQTESIARMFEWCESLEKVNMNDLDLSGVTQLYGIFMACKKLSGEMTLMNPNVTSFTLVFGDGDDTVPIEQTTAACVGEGSFVVNYIDDATRQTAAKMVDAAPSISKVYLGSLKQVN